MDLESSVGSAAMLLSLDTAPLPSHLCIFVSGKVHGHLSCPRGGSKGGKPSDSRVAELLGAAVRS